MPPRSQRTHRSRCHLQLLLPSMQPRPSAPPPRARRPLSPEPSAAFAALPRSTSVSSSSTAPPCLQYPPHRHAPPPRSPHANPHAAHSLRSTSYAQTPTPTPPPTTYSSSSLSSPYAATLNHSSSTFPHDSQHQPSTSHSHTPVAPPPPPPRAPFPPTLKATTSSRTQPTPTQLLVPVVSLWSHGHRSRGRMLGGLV
jgi:hypothetical protein